MSTITFAAPALREPRGTGRRPLPEPGPVVPRGDDEHLAFLLVATWSLRTGRRLRDVPPERLTESELLEFWDDPDRAAGPGGGRR
jgi:hypothetical protein